MQKFKREYSQHTIQHISYHQRRGYNLYPSFPGTVCSAAPRKSHLGFFRHEERWRFRCVWCPGLVGTINGTPSGRPQLASNVSFFFTNLSSVMLYPGQLFKITLNKPKSSSHIDISSPSQPVSRWSQNGYVPSSPWVLQSSSRLKYAKIIPLYPFILFNCIEYIYIYISRKQDASCNPPTGLVPVFFEDGFGYQCWYNVAAGCPWVSLPMAPSSKTCPAGTAKEPSCPCHGFEIIHGVNHGCDSCYGLQWWLNAVYPGYKHRLQNFAKPQLARHHDDKTNWSWYSLVLKIPSDLTHFL